MKMYINGILQSSQNSLIYSALNNDYNFYVGAHGYMLHNGQYVVADFFDGQMDELRVWNYQKNNQQINSLKDAPLSELYYNTIDSGLVGYWRFDVLEDLGINNDGPDDVRDFSVLHNHLDLAGDAHLVQYNTMAFNLFEKTYGGTGSELGIAIDNTSDGGFVIVGSTASFTINEIMYVLKLDSSGTLMWSKAYNAFGYDRLCGVQQTSDGGFYLSGLVEGGFGYFDHAMMKVDLNGNVIWAKYFGGIEAEELRKLSITPGGGLLVAGYNASFGVGAKEVQAIKLSSNGNILWAKTYGTLYEDFNSACKVASDGNYVLSGAVDITGSYGIRPTLIKLDTLGNIIWAKYYSGYIEDWGRDLIQTPDGGFLLVGDTESYGYGNSRDICIIKTNSVGNVVWAKAYGGIGEELVHCVVAAPDGKYIISGTTSSYGFGNRDAFMMKFDINGSVDWFHTYGGITADYGYDLVTTPDNGLALSGRRSSNTLGGYDVYLIKTDANGYSSCAYGTFTPNIFSISNLQAINLNMATFSNVSAADLSVATLIPSTAENIICAVVPVELKTFNYKIENGKVILNWSTATELNNYGFEIERSEQNREWCTIGFIEGNGTTTETKNYLYTDDLFGVNTEKIFYRLKQIDFNGTFSYSDEIEVNILPKEFKLYQNYPNPFNSSTVISYQLPVSSKITLKIYDVLGNLMVTLIDEEKQPGKYEVDFNTSNIKQLLSSGIYFYTLSADGFMSTKKMILLK
jgi:hypothetical protein